MRLADAAGMVAGADSIDDMNQLRHGGMGTLFDRIYAPSTLGSFLWSFTFGHIRQLGTVASRSLTDLATHAPALISAPAAASSREHDGYVFVDVDDTIIEVHGPQKQGVGFGCSGIRGLNALLATVPPKNSAPVVVAQQLQARLLWQAPHHRKTIGALGLISLPGFYSVPAKKSACRRVRSCALARARRDLMVPGLTPS